MSVTVTGTYASTDHIRNAEDDLLACGIPSETIYVDEEAKQIKVIIPAATKAEVLEILNRHRPTQIS